MTDLLTLVKRIEALEAEVTSLRERVLPTVLCVVCGEDIRQYNGPVLQRADGIECARCAGTETKKWWLDTKPCNDGEETPTTLSAPASTSGSNDAWYDAWCPMEGLTREQIRALFRAGDREEG